MRTKLSLLLLCLLAAPLLSAAVGEPGRYQSTRDYLSGAFPDKVPVARTLWLQGDLREEVEDLLGHPFAALRVRYWFDGRSSAWVLNEIGKEQAITIGVTVEDEAIKAVRILEYRETRGWEVRYPFFTDQFRGAKLTPDHRLSQSIDGITGATLSVAAVDRVARVALLLHAKIKQTS